MKVKYCILSIFIYLNIFSMDLGDLTQFKMLDIRSREQEFNELKNAGQILEMGLIKLADDLSRKISYETIGNWLLSAFFTLDKTWVKILIYAAKPGLNFAPFMHEKFYQLTLQYNWTDIFEMLLKKEKQLDKNYIFRFLIKFQNPVRKDFFEILLKYVDINFIDRENKTILDWLDDECQNINCNIINCHIIKEYLISKGAKQAKDLQ